MPQVEVTFDIDANGVLSVKAKDKATGKEQSVRIEASTGLSKEEIERMKKDAELHAAEDQRKKELVEARNTADAMIYTTEKALRDAEGKIPEDVKKEIEEKVAALKQVKDSDDRDAVKKASQELAQTTQKIGEILYKASEAAQGKADGDGTGTGGGPSTDSSGPNVKDAEVEDKPDDDI